MTEAGRMLIVDDEPAITNMLREFFSAEGYACSCAETASVALQLTATGAFDVVLLDVNMPGMDGFELCRRLRERLACPIIFLTARVEDADRLAGFAAGGDDYVLKPFSLEVLAGRVRAHMARERRTHADRRSTARSFGSVTIDYAARTVTVAAAPDGSADMPTPRRLDFTRTEFDILALLSSHPGNVYDRDTIYERVWGWDAQGDPSIVREHVRRIRRKLAEANAPAACIETVWGVGYRWGLR